jgi:hypothetical protein
LLANQIGNPFGSRPESGFLAITESSLDHHDLAHGHVLERTATQLVAHDVAGASLGMKGTGLRHTVGIATDLV